MDLSQSFKCLLKIRKEEQSLMEVGRPFQILLPLTDRADCEKEVRLTGIAQSPLVVALVLGPLVDLRSKN